MTTSATTQQHLCIYRDEAIGAKPIPLVIKGAGLRVKKSSEYFTGAGIVIDLGLDQNGTILHVDLGADIRVDLGQMRLGLEIGPLGLLPVHVLQLGSGFNPETGGTLRFGYMKRIFSKRYFGLIFKNLISKVMSEDMLAKHGDDLSACWQEIYGEGLWGIYDISIQKNHAGQWVVFAHPPVPGLEPITELVAYFNVNRVGVALGIREMDSL